MTRDIRRIENIAGQKIENANVISRFGDLEYRNLGIVSKLGLLDSGKALITGSGLRVEPSSLMVVNVSAGLALQRISSTDVIHCNQITDQTVAMDAATGSPRIDIVEAQLKEAVDKNSLDIRYYLSVRKQISTTTATAATAGSVTGTVDLSTTIDLSTRYIINIAIGEDGGFQEVNCQGVDPIATTKTEIIDIINAVAGFIMATSSGNFIKLTGNGTGRTSKFLFQTPAANSDIDALQDIFGISTGGIYKYTYEGVNEWFKLAEIDVGAATTVITEALIRNIDRRGTWASQKDDVKVFRDQIYNKQLWEQTQISELSFIGIAQQTPGSGYSGNFQDIAYSSNLGLFCAVGETGEIQTSPDGVTWTQQTEAGAPFSDYFSGVTYSSNLGLFCVVGDNGEIQTSSDGVTWTNRTSGSSYTGAFNNIIYSSDLTLFCAVGASGEIQTSPDGVTWTQQTEAGAPFSGFFLGVTYGNGLFCIVGASGEIQTSPNGVTWTKQTQAGAFAGDFYNITYSSNLGLFCVVGTSGEIQTSSDGVTWTNRTSAGGYSGVFWGIIYKNGIFCIVGASGEIQTSSDGVTWTNRTSAGGYSGVLRGTTYGNGKFCLVGQIGEIETTFKLSVDEGF